MRVVLQIGQDASVSIDNKIYSSIKDGLVLLVGFTSGDNEEIINKVIDKILSLRIYPDSNGKTNLDLGDREVLCVSQFSLYGDISHGRRPSFINALEPLEASRLYEYTINYLKSKLGSSRIKTGVFGGDMIVTLSNIGPFTLMIDSKDL